MDDLLAPRRFASGAALIWQSDLPIAHFQLLDYSITPFLARAFFIAVQRADSRNGGCSSDIRRR